MKSRWLLFGAGLLFAGCTEVTNTVRFHEDVQPLIQKHCQKCHTEGSIAPFALDTYEQAAEHAFEMVAQTHDRLMPPWHVDESGDCGEFKDSPRLTDEEIAIFAKWAEDGTPRGNPSLAPPPPEPPETLERVDAVADMGVEYVPDANLTDDYRCFVIDLGLTEDKFLTKYEMVPGQPRVVHHSNTWMALTPEDSLRAEELDAADPKPGYECFAGPLVEALPIILWAPGKNLVDLSNGGFSGIRLKAGSKLIMQVHYNLSAGPLPDRTKINLKLQDEVFVPTFVGAIRDQDMNLQPGLEDVVTSEEILVNDIFGIFGVDPRDIRIYAFGGHMHFRGKTLRVEVTHEDGSTECIGNIPDWDFHWQMGYFYETGTEPLIKPTDRVKVTCTFDTSEDTDPIFYGENTTDEMCVGAFYISI